MVPNVETAEQAHQLISCVRIPPLGKRGAATSTRNSGYGFHYAQYLAEANDNLLVAAQIESRVGLHNVEAIAAVPGYNGIMFGPGDFSHRIGLAGQINAPEVVAARKHVAAVARRQYSAATMMGTRPVKPEKHHTPRSKIPRVV
jgi:2-keto-3-deoxy-L-rhamnonate aldolase RhmA